LVVLERHNTVQSGQDLPTGLSLGKGSLPQFVPHGALRLDVGGFQQLHQYICLRNDVPIWRKLVL